MNSNELLHQFQTEKEKEKSPHTVLAYISDLKQFFAWLKKNFQMVTSEDIEKYKEYLLDKRRVKPKTINRKLVSIRQYITYINKLELGDKIDVEIKLIKIQHQEYLDNLLTVGDLERILAAADRENDVRAIAIIQGMYLTGARVSELLRFKVDDAAKDEIIIKGKGNKFRSLFPPERLRGYFRDYLKVRNSDQTDLLFVNKSNGKPMDRQSVHNLIKKYAGMGKVKLSRAHAHNLRHMYCYRLIEKGLNIDEVADLAGHSNINTTRIYTRKPKAELMKAIRNL
jgi:integrase/recombinase XerD